MSHRHHEILLFHRIIESPGVELMTLHLLENLKIEWLHSHNVYTFMKEIMIIKKKKQHHIYLSICVERIKNTTNSQEHSGRLIYWQNLYFNECLRINS